MGDKSDSKTKKASSPYVVLENRPLDQWKVTELKEELKKRKLITRGLKEELVKRLDEAIRAEMDDDDDTVDAMDHTMIQNEKLEKDNRVDDLENKSDENTDVEMGTNTVHVDDGLQSLTEKTVTKDHGGIASTEVETAFMVSEASGGGSNQEPRNGEPKPESRSPEQEPAEPGSSDLISGKQVDEVSKVQSDSISVDTISIIEKNELKDNVIGDEVKSEAVKVAKEKDIDNVKSTGFINDKDNVIANDVKLVNESLVEKVIAEEKDVNGAENVDISKKNDSGDVAVEDKTAPSVTSTKRKPNDLEKAAENSETLKRQRKWNSENLEVPKQPTNLSTSTTPKDAFQTVAKPAFSRSESTKSQDLPKARVVPPSSKAPTTSLRIDNFLRPFTLKAVQEFLGKTGTVVSFWMDQIKTHCYVTYASVEEAIETRNAVCNLQWPVNGGRLLMADFVDPQEVKNRVDPPPPSPETPSTTTAAPLATVQPPQPSPRLKQPLPTPPPPPLSNPPPARNRAPPPLEKVDPPIVTLDDLFKKTRATPRIYYLPLSDEQVAAKLKGQGKPKPGNA
ncbi:calponin homology domain-containing protein DDB_G0272472 isoform X3 [Helianthus annuus]|uniref:calponin homology domain-containing protein DDB_G0272472 isoform X3 n=1 Tax=Helianthus annuus TaxID=4232 RepID=UPI0016531986|nr:calponin homology domain-containing protein DDB_G0272472 isoform X3 [Helianthus annuus]